ncbi:hypothetical protein RHGRI_029226 [Rhododendron griersonianum]|uniref:TAZ-type domain-containing protein n=1 Tax=Rhododendron griersonianum TaxID=479676 RepID=A0AAV6IIH2_9ERIC|nr:hypothetical protein RHGRI_029226 [Rhododendron griersonianum]
MPSEESPLIANEVSPVPPPLPSRSCHPRGLAVNEIPVRGYSCVSTATRDLWECLFNDGYRADVSINTEDGGIIYAHASILILLELNNPRVIIVIAVLVVISYEPAELQKYVLHLLVLSHAYVVPHLKRLCEWRLEHGLLTIENMIDTFQLALLCDAPRLSFICHRLILKNFIHISTTEGWKIMQQSHPMLEKEILESLRRKERARKLNEKKIYLQLYEAMEALVHICRDGCRTIGPHDKVLKVDQGPCNYESCKSLELLVRHFAGCKMRVPGGCIHCKRMWQLLELHSHLCADSDVCRVPLCRSIL